jgi:hypothetical protein
MINSDHLGHPVFPHRLWQLKTAAFEPMGRQNTAIATENLLWFYQEVPDPIPKISNCLGVFNIPELGKCQEKSKQPKNYVLGCIFTTYHYI